MNPSIPAFSSLIDLLAYRAKTCGQRTAFTFSGNGVTYDRLWQSIDFFGAHLLANGIRKGDRVVIALPNGEDFFSVFYGVQRAGGIAVPIFPGSGLERIAAFADRCGARTAVLPRDRYLSLDKEALQKTMGMGFRIIPSSGLRGHSPIAPFPVIESNDLAMIQYTSGSSGEPKGVPLSHHNLLTNIQQMIQGMEITPEDIFVSWLPVYHDMGLILMTMTPFYLGAEAHLLPSEVQEISVWLEEIQKRRATFTAAPDFAYRLCVRRVEDPHTWDLGSLRVALNAAEPVRLSTVQEFEEKFRLENVMTAGYGLAEATVGVSMSSPHGKIRHDKHGRVSVGRPFTDVEIIITADGIPQPAGKEGEILIRSTANAEGYFNDPGEGNQTFLQDGFLRSGDLGYLDEEGYLYIVGREKTVIKRFGETISPQEIEEAADSIQEVRYSAAIGIDRGGLEGEQIFVFVEVRTPECLNDGWYDSLSSKVVQSIQERMGIKPGRVYLLKPRSIPRTHNGKIQHLLLKQCYLSGELRAGGWILHPEY